MTEQIVGHLLYRNNRLDGEPGAGYNYILAGNGLFIQARNSMLLATVPVAQCRVRGLQETSPQVTLGYGKIPQVFFELALNAILANKEKELYLALTWKDGYHLFKTNQEGTGGSVKYDCLENTVMDIHSHPGQLRAFFSSQDDFDEQGFRLSMVIGRLEAPELRVRIGVYGSFFEMPWADVFDGKLKGATDRCSEVEVIQADELQGQIQIPGPAAEDSLGRGWWDRVFGGRWPV